MEKQEGKKETGNKKKKSLILSFKGNLRVIYCDEIRYCEAAGVYTKIHLRNGSEYYVAKPLYKIEDMLDDCHFRCHKSYIVNLACLKIITKEGIIVLQDNSRIHLARRRRKDLLEWLEGLN